MVVVVIGVLAAVILPKFNKVLETRKVTEAEEMMTAVRKEQERRCSLDKPYLTNISKLADLVPNANTNNYDYALLSGGIKATSKGDINYTLQIPSYADGRICCEGANCNKLNKDYPTCDELRSKPDYVAAGGCVGDETEGADPASCSGNAPVDTYDCCTQEGLMGTKTNTYVCNANSGNWEPGVWQGTCSPVPPPEPYPQNSQCANGTNPGVVTCTKTYKCDGTYDISCTESGCFEWKLVKQWCQGACTGDGYCPGGEDYDCHAPPNSTCTAANEGEIKERYSIACFYDPDAGTFGEGGFALSYCDYQCVRV